MSPPRPLSLWVTTQWLDDVLRQRQTPASLVGEWRLLEVGCDHGAAYRTGHIAGAGYIDTHEVESLPLWNVVPPVTLRAVLARHGLRFDTQVILYGRQNYAAERLAHILLYAGVQNVRLLDGGWQCWQQAGLAQMAGPSPKVMPQDFGAPLPAQPQLLRNLAQTLALRQHGEIVLVSVRSWAEFSGAVSGYDYIATAGDIPGARWGHAEGTSQYICAYHNPDGTLRSAQEIAALWAKEAISSAQSVVFYCGTGWRASLAFLVAWSLGWQDIAVYDGGWFEWSQQYYRE
ncbi:Thiosulfate sulfurtransferase -like protein [Enterobacter sp. FY-07]|uniref:sulfurtransferase n=1 Tax=Kosakonia oryzendophytica TaxID=1005665 RepID=UPI00077733D9|nr:rhodanese-like domain-containing protein [Kosakonia oryzendophytica]AMO49111.1 Thiosulfate sulfurtransferase -like protein [Enterobacter sp. FY-07]WBT56413.1 rhodanese-like domain-containing protein [Kosakonia oryzendophytica]